MYRKLFFTFNILILLLIVFPASGIFGLFNSQAASANNSFSTANSFPTSTPSPTIAPSPSPTVNPSGNPSPNPSPTPPSSQFDFPVCPQTPGADVNGKKWDVGYDVGEHWIIDQGMKHGSDYVYYLDDTKKVLQCFYPLPSSDGIQTNWLKKEKKGDNPDWPSYPNGADFGLSRGVYFYKNSVILMPQPTSTPSPTPLASSSPEATSGAEVNQ